MDKRGFPTSLPEFQRAFPDDGACARYLEAMRWPNGFACQHCGLVSEPYRFPTRSSVVFRCRGLQGQYIAHGRNRHAIEPYAALDVVLGRISHDYIDTWPVRRSVSTPACTYPL